MAGVKKGMPLETVTHMLEVLSKYKDELEAENSETQLEILLEFLTTSRSLKEKTLADKSQHLRHLESDISLVRPTQEIRVLGCCWSPSRQGSPTSRTPLR